MQIRPGNPDLQALKEAIALICHHKGRALVHSDDGQEI